MKFFIFVVLAITMLQSGSSLPDEDLWTEQSHDSLLEIATPGSDGGSLGVSEFDDDGAEARDDVKHIMAEIRDTAMKIPVLNLSDVLSGIVEQAEADLKALEARKDAEKAKKKAARSEFRANRSSLRKDYRACKKSITSDNINLNAPVCKAFKAGQTTAIEDSDSFTLTEVDAFVMKRRRAAPAAEGDTGRRRGNKKAYKSLRKSLRPLKRQARRNFKADFKKVKRAYKDFKKELRRAKFKVKILPKVMAKVKPAVTKAMSKMTGMDEASKKSEEVVEEAPVDDIAKPETLKEFVSMKLHDFVGGNLQKVFDKIQSLIWQFVDPIVTAIQSALVTAVGSIPFVGGLLAAVVGTVFDTVMNKVKDFINGKIDELRQMLEDKICDAILKVCFKMVKGVLSFFKDDKKAIESAGTGASTSFNGEITAQYEAENKAAEAEAPSDDEFINDANQEKEDQEAEDAEDDKADNDENAADDKEEKDAPDDDD